MNLMARIFQWPGKTRAVLTPASVLVLGLLAIAAVKAGQSTSAIDPSQASAMQRTISGLAGEPHRHFLRARKVRIRRAEGWFFLEVCDPPAALSRNKTVAGTKSVRRGMLYEDLTKSKANSRLELIDVTHSCSRCGR